MATFLVGFFSFLAGIIVCWIFKTRTQNKIQSELDSLKAAAVQRIDKL